VRGDSNRRGAALIEALIAVVVLATAGIGLITLLGQTAHSMRGTLETERLTRAASEQLDWVAALSRTELVERIGRTQQSGWTLEVIRAAPDLFDVHIARTTASSALLHTTLYRPDSTDERP
jgi:Tfp pilus assembly protein PilV